VNRRTTLAGLLAGLGALGQALAQDGEWTVPRVLQVVVGVALALFGVFAKDCDKDDAGSVARRLPQRSDSEAGDSDPRGE